MLKALLLNTCACINPLFVPSQFLLKIRSFLADLCGVQGLSLRSFWIFEVVVDGIEELLIFLDGG